MKRRVLVLAAACLVWLAGCRSAVVPQERLFRLDAPTGSPGSHRGGGILRVFDLQLGRAVDADCLVIADGVRLEPRTLDRWVAPLDRLVTDALVAALSRANCCALVKGGHDPGPETWSLHGRIVEFAEARLATGNEAHVVLELWLEDQGGLRLQGEFAAAEVLAEPGAAAAVAGLSRCLHRVAGDVVARLRAAGVLAVAEPAPEGR